MNLAEFKAWFEGYTENMRDVPTAKQWARIKDRVSEITAQATEIRYFWDNYWRPYYNGPYYGQLTSGYCSNAMSAVASNALSDYKSLGSVARQQGAEFSVSNSTDAFRVLGRADAVSEAA